MLLAVMIALLAVGVTACRSEGPATQTAVALTAPALPDDEAGRAVARAIEAAGGWATWREHRDASFISTMTIYDPLANPVSETIFMHKMPLHQGIRARVESIGISDEIVFGFDGENEWMIQAGKPVTQDSRTSFTRFYTLSSAYWFSLPFILGEIPGELTHLGTEKDGDRTLEKVRVDYADSVPLPFDWLVLYFETETAKLDRVQVHALAEFLQQPLWVGLWREERQAGGIQVHRRRAFFASNLLGEISGGMAAEQMIEHVEFDRDLPPELFQLPTAGLTREIES